MLVSLAMACDLIGAFSLFLVRDSLRWGIAIIVLLTVLPLIFRVRVSDKVTLVIGTIVLCTSIVLIYSNFQIVGKILALGLLGIHGLLLVVASESYYRPWRFVFSFLELVLAAVLQPESYNLVLIALYSVLCFSYFFLIGFEACSRKNSLKKQVPYRALFCVWAILLVLGAALFPLLPRLNLDHGKIQIGKVDYTEKVVLDQNLVSMQAGEKRVLLRFYRKNGSSKYEFPFNLIRGKTLSAFDGNSWGAVVKPSFYPEKAESSDVSYSIVREKMDSDVLPVPYGEIGVTMSEPVTLHTNTALEWLYSGARGKVVQYKISVGEKPTLPSDPPRKIHLAVPSTESMPSIVAFADKFKNSTKPTLEKLRVLAEHFSKYKPTLFSGQENDVSGHPIEYFFQNSRAGHCELFATAAAIILRKAGTPVRLVSGFRIPSDRYRDSITVYNTDAHAWLEVWDNSRQHWIPFDPTPFVLNPSVSWMQALLNFEWLDSLWYQTILAFEFDFEFALSRLFFLVCTIFLIGVFAKRGFSTKDLVSEIVRFAKLLVAGRFLLPLARMVLDGKRSSVRKSLVREEYLRARFGAQKPGWRESLGLVFRAILVR